MKSLFEYFLFEKKINHIEISDRMVLERNPVWVGKTSCNRFPFFLKDITAFLFRQFKNCVRFFVIKTFLNRVDHISLLFVQNFKITWQKRRLNFSIIIYALLKSTIKPIIFCSMCTFWFDLPGFAHFAHAVATSLITNTLFSSNLKHV